MTLEAYYKLNESDIVACEDKKIAQKLFENLEKKKLGQKFRNFFEQKMLLNDYNYDTNEFFRKRSDLFGQGLG
jgi:16S rRNA C1402 (ribose-2'-O) methylase RsmI